MKPSRDHKRIAAGKCVRCCKTRDGVSVRYCDACLKILRERMRQRKGCNAWKPGGRGRPPMVTP